MSSIATACHYGALATPEHISHAVKEARAKLNDETVTSVLLFLTCGYAHAPQSAIREAVITAGTPMVFGACSINLICQQEWLLDVEGATVMLFAGDYDLQAYAVGKSRPDRSAVNLCLSSPNAADIAMASISEPQFGAIVSDFYGHGPYSLWQSGRVAEQEYIHCALVKTEGEKDFDQSQVFIGKASGIRRLTEVFEVTSSHDNCIVTINDRPAGSVIKAQLPANIYSIGIESPFNLVAAISETSDQNSLNQGHYQLLHVVEINESNDNICLSDTVPEGHHIFWAVRDQKIAESQMQSELERAKRELRGQPKFALIFPNLSRGTQFYNGEDMDLQMFEKYFADLPMIGLYGHGEITPGFEQAGTCQFYSTVFAIFA